MSGTYTILVQPTKATLLTFTVSLTSGLTGTPTVNSQANYTSVNRGQGVQLNFTGTAGQYLSVGVVQLCAIDAGFIATVLKPDGTVLLANTAPTLSTVGCPVSTYSQSYGTANLNLPALPMSGTYTILVQPTKATLLTFTVSLSGLVPGNLVINGSSVTSALSIIGQGAQLAFTGTAAQNLAVTMSTSCMSTGGGSVTVLNPDKTTLTSASMTSTVCTGGSYGSLTLNIPTLSVSGTYTVLFRQASTGTGTLTSTLKTR
jgi:hypothetical protein